VKLPALPTLNSIKSVAAIDSLIPLNITSAGIGVARRRRNVIVVGNDAGFPPAALMRIWTVASLLAVAPGIRLDMLSWVEVMFVHLVPFVLNSMRLETPSTTSADIFRVKSAGYVVATLGTATLLIIEAGTVAVALVLTITVEAAFPKTLRAMFLEVTDAHVSPLLRLNSIAVDTPVIMSVPPL